MTIERFLDLGELEVVVDGRRRGLGGRIPATLLAVLLINLNRRVGPDALREAVWGDDASARATLSTHIWRLRNVLEPDRGAGTAPAALINDAGGYRLLAAIDAVDSARFEQIALETDQLLQTAQPERALRRADEGLALWRGEPYGSLADHGVVAPVLAKLEELRSGLRRARVDALLGIGDVGLALASLHPLLADRPLDEGLWGRRMVAEYRSGRVDAALDSFQQIRRLLDDELGVSAGRELRTLQQRILRQDPALAAPPAGRTVQSATTEVHLPSGPGRVIGRTADLEQLGILVRRHQVTTVVGAAGCGKTTAAIAVARSLVGEFVDGLWFIDLSSITEPQHVVSAAASQLHTPVPPTGDVLDALRSRTRGRRLLLIIDNAEHLLDATAELLSTLLVDAPELSVLVTSREPLLVPGEQVHRLAPLDLPPARAGGLPPAEDVVLPTTPSPSVELFIERMPPELRPGPQQREDWLAIEDICTAVDGLPLAIELAAARCGAFSLSEIAAQVRADASTLQAIGRGSDHHRTLRTAIDRSYRLLSSDQQEVHRHLALVPGGVTVDTVAALTGRSAADVGGVLAQLVHRSLLTPRPAERAAGATRFVQLAAIRGHADHQVRPAERAEAQNRLDTYVLALLSGRGRRGRAEEADWMERLDDNLDALRASFRRHLIDAPGATGVDLFTRVGIYWYFRGRMVEARGWIGRAAAVTDAVTPMARALIEIGIASGQCWRSRGDLAREPIRAALERTDDAESDRSVRWGEQLAIAAYGVFAAHEAGLGLELDSRLRRIAAATGDRDIACLADGAGVLAAAMNEEPGQVLARADAVHDHVAEVDNVLARWFVADGATAAAVAAGDARAGRRWSDRAAQACRRLRVGEGSVLLEQRANVFALARDHRSAAELYAAAQLHQRRNGLIDWNFPHTADLLRRTQAGLDDARFRRAWAAGSSMTIDRALTIDAR